MAKIKTEDIDALRERADIVEIVSGYTHLKKAGAHTFKGLCPFHSEKTPSFSVNTGSNLWHCFGCQRGGNLYQFVQEIENLPFPEAVEWVARKVGVELRYEEARPGEQTAVAGQRGRLIKANEAAARFFHDTLMKSPEAAAARRYLGGRGFSEEVAERWLLGYAPGRDQLCRHLLGKGFTAAEITAADLGRKSDRDGSLYDTFRGRITFPTWNLQGEVVAFGGRAMGDQQPKYINTSDTPVFSKSRIMYGLNKAKASIARGAALVVEGYTDVIALHEAGITEAIATNGVALGETHFELLKKFSERAILMFDADDAGKGATERGFGIHHRIGLEVLVAPLPAGQDPADVALESGAEAVRKLIDGAVPLLEFKLDQTLSQTGLDTPEARARAVREAARVLGWHPDPIARHEYAFVAARRIGVDVDAMHRALADELQGTASSTGGTSDGDRDRRLPGNVKVEREALQLLLMGVEQAADWEAQLGEADFTSSARRELFRTLRNTFQENGAMNKAALAEELSAEALSLYAELAVSEEPTEPSAERIDEVFRRLRLFRLERDIKSRRNTLQDINPLEEPERHDQLFTELVSLEADRRDLMNQLQSA
ncbi:MAG TPA: DNA primase [Actinomycetota bacterium]|nr:DNA primase [Actinomycetota bacterium]